MIRFGPMSIALLCGALYGLLRAAMLCFVPARRCANRLLAALIVVLALYTAPYIIGYAGYYDAYPWLSFAPYNLTLAAGPLFYLYLACLGAGGAAMPPRWYRHLLPALLQLAYYCGVYAQPLAFKNDWDARVHLPYIDPLETCAVLLSLGAYWWLAWRRHRQAEAGLREWTRNLAVAMGLTLVFWCLLVAAELAWSGLSYFQRFPFYLWLALLVGYLGTEGYRHGVLPAPARPLDPPRAAAPIQAELGASWRDTVAAEGWWRDPELSLATVARRLGTNAGALSRALNEGLGLNFNEAINQMRIDAVLAALRQDGDTPVLDIAMAAGFNSKASFNRAFKLLTGETPTAYRRRAHAPAPAQVSSS